MVGTYYRARIKYSLATEIYGLPHCFHALNESISLYRQCLSVQPDSIDAAYNLAQSLQTLGEWAAENGPSTSAVLTTSSRDALLEAKTLLGQVEAAQMAQMATRSSTNTPDNGMSGATTPVGNSDDSNAIDAALAESGEAVEETIITPSAVIETILSNVEVTLALIDSDGEQVLQEAEALLQRAEQLNERDHYMGQEIRDAKAEALRALLEAQAAAGQQQVDLSPLQAIAEAQQRTLQELRRPDPAKLSELADTLYSYADIGARQVSVPVAEQLTQALELYEKARSILESPLARPAGTPAHHVPSLLCANWRSCTEAHLLLAHLDADRSAQHSKAAIAAAVAALDVLNGPIKSAASGDFETTKFAKRVQSRSDYRTISGMKEAVLLVVRTYVQSNGSVMSKVPSEFEGLVGLIRGTWPDRADAAWALDSYVQDCKGTAAWKLYGQNHAGGSEEDTWRAFAQLFA